MELLTEDQATIFFRPVLDKKTTSQKNNTARKIIFLSPGISWKVQKHQANIIFPLTFWLEKRPYFPSPINLKKELFRNQ